MAKATKTTGNQAVNITNHNLILRPANRGRQDIKGWRTAHISAEHSQMELRNDLYDLFDDALLDPHLSSVIDKRLMAVTNTKLRFVKNGDDVPEVQKIIKSKEFKKLLREILNSKMWGLTLAELSFNEFNAWIVPRKHIRPTKGIIATEQHGNTGFSYREGQFLNTMVEVGETKSYGLLLKAVPYVLYKRGCLGDWSQFTEVFGMPTKVGRYSGYDDKTRIELEAALDEAGSALSIVIPEEAKIEFLESKMTSGSSDLYKALVNMCDEQLSVLILGQTETTKSSQSSGYAQSKTHARTEDDINQDDRAFVISILETSVNHCFTQAGLPMEGGEWVFEDDEEDVPLDKRVIIDTTLRSAGLPIDDDYFYERYNIPKPANYDKLKKEKAAQAKQAATPNNNLAISEDLLQKMADFFA